MWRWTDETDGCNGRLTRTMLMFSRNSQYGTRRENTPNPAETDTSLSTFFTRSADKRSGRASTKKSRPHSWHSTIQKGLARARSRSLGRDKEKDRIKRASSALTSGKYILLLFLPVNMFHWSYFRLVCFIDLTSGKYVLMILLPDYIFYRSCVRLILICFIDLTSG